MSRKPLIVGNWKMFKTGAEAEAIARQLVYLIEGEKQVEILICPPFTALSVVSSVLRGSLVKLGAQNVHWGDEGAFTGEVSALMLSECGCRYVITGHSERRQIFGESDAIINSKLRKVMEKGLVPILCVGESIAEREADQVEEAIVTQLQKGTCGLNLERRANIVIAYEPVWAIGTGKTATPQIAQAAHRILRTCLADNFSWEVADRIRILYGGSVKAENVAELMSEEDIDGALVGGDSLDAQSFARIVEACFEARVTGNTSRELRE